MTHFLQFLGVTAGAVVAIGVLWWLSAANVLPEGAVVLVSVLVVVVVPLAAIIMMDRRSRKAGPDS